MCNISGGLSRLPLFLYGWDPQPYYPVTASGNNTYITGSRGGNGVVAGAKGLGGIGYGDGGSGAAGANTGFGTRLGGEGGSGYVRISWEVNETPECFNIYVSSSCCPIDIGCTVYTDPELTVTASNGYYYDGTKCWIILNGVVNSTGSCGTTTTTTTTSTTTTTTTEVPTGYYNATQYSCPDCDAVGSVIAYSSTNLNIGTYYLSGS